MEKHGRVGQAIDDNTIRRMRIACWITKATDTHSEYVILIAFPLQQWLRERALMLRCTYICLSCYSLPHAMTSRGIRLFKRNGQLNEPQLHLRREKELSGLSFNLQTRGG